VKNFDKSPQYDEWAVHFQKLLARLRINPESLVTEGVLTPRMLADCLSGRHFPKRRLMRLRIATFLGVSPSELEGPMHRQLHVSSEGAAAKEMPTASLQGSRSPFEFSSSIRIYSNDQALEEICALADRAEVILNTKITRADSSDAARKLRSLTHWETAVRRAIRRGAKFKEVITPGYASHARARAAALKKAKGLYEVNQVGSDLGSFLNFTVFELQDGTEEAFFGWLISKSHGFEHQCFRSGDERVVNLFRDWFTSMFTAGTQIVPAPTSESRYDFSGYYACYAFASGNRNKVHVCAVTVSVADGNSFFVTIEMRDFTCTGKAYYSLGNFFVNTECTQRDARETLAMVFRVPRAENKRHMLTGVFSCTDTSQNPIAGRTLWIKGQKRPTPSIRKCTPAMAASLKYSMGEQIVAE
jgi:hypothetical protein